MSRLAVHRNPPYKATTISLARKWGPSLAMWSVGSGIMALYVLSVTPLVKRQFLVKLPVVGSYWEDKIPPSDKPF